MAKINIFVTHLDRTRFSGGILCVLQYGKGLVKKGHTVRIIPMRPSDRPLWIEGNFGWLPAEDWSDLLKTIAWSVGQIVKPSNFKRRNRKALKKAVNVLAAQLAFLCIKFLPSDIQKGVSVEYVRYLLARYDCAADVTVATAFETAMPVYLYGTGKKFYFAQHFEPLFSIDFEDSARVEREALLSYKLGLKLIANSSWLKERIRSEVGVDAQLCPNAIDQEVFRGDVKTLESGVSIRIISYGGRGARWKGFGEMAQAVRIARTKLGDSALRWFVYGQCELEPDNDIAPFEQLGFLAPKQLAEAYRSCDILLSASWYESFPLFPLEAMACGLAVITTASGTEEFAFHGISAEIVQARDPDNIAEAIVKLTQDAGYRKQIAIGGKEVAKKFTWDAAVSRMETILMNSADSESLV